MLSLHRGLGVAEVGGHVRQRGMLLGLDLGLKVGELGGGAPVGFKLLRRLGHLVLHAGTRDAFDGVRDRREEVCGGLARGADPALLLEEGLGLFGGSEVDLATFIENGGLVKDVINGLTSLVDGNDMDRIAQVSGDTQVVNELVGRRGIEASGAD